MEQKTMFHVSHTHCTEQYLTTLSDTSWLTSNYYLIHCQWHDIVAFYVALITGVEESKEVEANASEPTLTHGNAIVCDVFQQNLNEEKEEAN